MASALAWSHLFSTTSSGTSPAPMSASTPRTALICPSGSGSDASTTCTSRSAWADSSKVEENASTRSCGRCRTKPTVSVRVKTRPSVVCGSSGGRVQGGEQRVLDQHPGSGEPVQHTGLAGVGVADDGHRRDLVAAPFGPLQLSVGVELTQGGAQLRDPAVDPSTVGLQLRLAGTTAADAGSAARTSTRLPGEVATPPTESLLEVLQLGQLDLGLALGALGVGGEDVEDQRGPVDDLDLDLVLQVAQLSGSELAVADDRVGAGGDHDLPQLLHLAAADVGGRIGALAALDQTLEDLRARRLGEQLQLRHGVLGVDLAAGGPDAHQHDPLQQEPAVLHLGDVGQLGGHAGHAAQRLTLLALQLLTVVVGARQPLVGLGLGGAIGGVRRERLVGVRSGRGQVLGFRQTHRGTRIARTANSRRAVSRSDPAFDPQETPVGPAKAAGTSSSPRATITAGPVRNVSSPSSTSTVPPGTSTR